MSHEVVATAPTDDLAGLPWGTPLEDWPAEILATLPRGLSRHVVRFARIGPGGERVVAVKEMNGRLAQKELTLLTRLADAGEPAVRALAVVTGRATDDGEPLEDCLVTEHLTFSLPFRFLFNASLRGDTATKLIDALVVLLVRLHLGGLYWGDVSLSNALFRRDAGDFAAYVVDVETAEMHDTLSDGQREYDLRRARENIAGELMDLQAGGLLSHDADPVATADTVVSRYTSLWDELHRVEAYDHSERWRADARVRRLNELGFDVERLDVDTQDNLVVIQPKIVEAGHHSRRLMRLTGLDVEENQARRLLNDLDTYRAFTHRHRDHEESVAADWVRDNYGALDRALPRELRGKLALPELFHEVLEHRWYLSERAGQDVLLHTAIDDYVANVLPTKPDEARVFELPPPLD